MDFCLPLLEHLFTSSSFSSDLVSPFRGLHHCKHKKTTNSENDEWEGAKDEHKARKCNYSQSLNGDNDRSSCRKDRIYEKVMEGRPRKWNVNGETLSISQRGGEEVLVDAMLIKCEITSTVKCLQIV